MTTLPSDFLWGAASAAYQVEGGINNNDWAAAGEEGKVPLAVSACEHFSRYAEDFDLAAALSQNAHRFSIEWARIEPVEGEFDPAAVAHYRDVLQALRARGLEPVVTFWHFTLPAWFAARGGFLAKGAAEIFARYCGFLADTLGSQFRLCLTMNEPQIYAGKGYFSGDWPPFRRNPIQCIRVVYALADAHVHARAAIKKARPELRVGVAKHNFHFEANHNPFCILVGKVCRAAWNHWFLRQTRGHYDFVGLNYYRRIRVGKPAADSPSPLRSDTDWDVLPEGIFDVLLQMREYDVPIYVTESGIADAGDTARREFIRRTVAATQRAYDHGIQVAGFFYWSLTDNFEWSEATTKRFGLIAVDFSTQERSSRPSATYYSEICASNGIVAPGADVT